MQINVITAPTSEAFNQLLFKNQHPAHAEYFQQQVTKFSNTLTDAGREFMAKSKAIYEKIHDSSVIRAAQAAIRMVKAVRHPNAIWAMKELDDFRCAKSVMARWMMTMPELRDLQERRLIAGYDGYVDLDKGKSGNQQYDFRRVMDGVVQTAEDGTEYYERYYEELRADDRELTDIEKLDILSSHRIARMYLEALEDVTDKFGGKLPYL